MRISIALATYNGERYIRDQLQSFVDQTRLPDELIITDDCSSDQTEAIIREFAEGAPFKVAFFRNQRNLGYSGNFNAALTKTTGDLVFLSDQDDVWFPDKIAHMVGVAEKNSATWIVMNDAALTDGELRPVGLTKLGQFKSAGLSTSNFVMGCCCAIRRDLLEICLPIPSNFKAHDGWLVWFAEGLNRKIIDYQVLQFYRRHESNESQILINRMAKVTQVQLFVHRVKQLLDGQATSRDRVQIEQLELFLGGIRRSVSMSGPQLQPELEKFLSDTDKKLKTLVQRSEIREKQLLPRFVAVLWFVIRGGYRDEGLFRGILRDLIG